MLLYPHYANKKVGNHREWFDIRISEKTLMRDKLRKYTKNLGSMTSKRHIKQESIMCKISLRKREKNLKNQTQEVCRQTYRLVGSF